MDSIVKRISSVLSLLCVAMTMSAQMPSPVKCATSLKKIDANVVELRITATVEEGWHVYSTELEDGPTTAMLVVETIEGARLDGKLGFEGEEIAKYDDMFGMEVRYFENKVTFVQRFVITEPDYKVKGYFQYGACDDENCMPPTDVPFSLPLTPQK